MPPLDFQSRSKRYRHIAPTGRARNKAFPAPVGQGSAAQHTPSAPCQRQGSDIRRTKATSQRFSTSLARDAATPSSVPAPIVKNKATHPAHARAFCWGQGSSAASGTSSAQEPFAKGLTRDPAAPLRVSRQGQRPAASPTRSGIAKAAPPSAAKRPCAKRSGVKIRPGERATASAFRYRPRALGISRPPPQDREGRNPACRTRWVDNSPLRALQ